MDPTAFTALNIDQLAVHMQIISERSNYPQITTDKAIQPGSVPGDAHGDHEVNFKRRTQTGELREANCKAFKRFSERPPRIFKF